MTTVRQNSLLRLFPARLLYPWLVCLTGMLFYCYNYFLRVSPSVMQQSLTDAFHLSAAQFGALAGFYYWAYTPMQLPAGMIYDKFGARMVLTVACLIAVLGLAFFITANSYPIACLGRLLIGFGTAFSYIGVLKLASLWLPPNRFATVAGMTTALGMTCAALSQKYLTHIVDTFGYKTALHSALLAGGMLSFIILLLIKSRPKNNPLNTNSPKTSDSISMKQLLQALKTIASKKQLWLIGITGCLLYLPASVFLDLWGIPYLKTVYHLTDSAAVTLSSVTFAGWIISGPIIGALSDRIKLRRLPLIIFGGLGGLLLCIIFYYPGITYNTLRILFFFAGFCCGAHPLCFALGRESSPEKISGTAIAATNMLIMAGGAIFQPIAGQLLDWHAKSHNTLTHPMIYNSADYTFALSIIPIGVLIGIAISLFIKETHCKVEELK